jgi:hypothetical protein
MPRLPQIFFSGIDLGSTSTHHRYVFVPPVELLIRDDLYLRFRSNAEYCDAPLFSTQGAIGHLMNHRQPTGLYLVCIPKTWVIISKVAKLVLWELVSIISLPRIP